MAPHHLKGSGSPTTLARSIGTPHLRSEGSVRPKRNTECRERTLPATSHQGKQNRIGKIVANTGFGARGPIAPDVINETSWNPSGPLRSATGSDSLSKIDKNQFTKHGRIWVKIGESGFRVGWNPLSPKFTQNRFTQNL